VLVSDCALRHPLSLLTISLSSRASCCDVDRHSSSVLRIDGNCDVVVSSHTHTRRITASSCCLFHHPPMCFIHCVLPLSSLRSARDVHKSTQLRLLLHSYWSTAQIISVGRPICGAAAIRVVQPNSVSVSLLARCHRNKIDVARTKQYSANSKNKNKSC
jgi:hypothetical protein